MFLLPFLFFLLELEVLPFLGFFSRCNCTLLEKSMSSLDQQGLQDGIMEDRDGTTKREAPSGNSPVLKRAHLESESVLPASSKEAEGANAEEEGEEKIVSETDVGIAAYVNESLIPITGGIIKQR
jgi:hypothetical protein